MGELRADRAELGRDRAGQMVGGQVEKGEAGEPSQFRWDRTSQLIAPGQAQLAQCGQLAQLGGDRAVQSLSIHVQLRHPLDAVQRRDGDPVPGAERGVGAPVEGRRASQGRLQIEQDPTVRHQLRVGRRLGHDHAVRAAPGASDAAGAAGAVDAAASPESRNSAAAAPATTSSNAIARRASSRSACLRIAPPLPPPRFDRCLRELVGEVMVCGRRDVHVSIDTEYHK